MTLYQQCPHRLIDAKPRTTSPGKCPVCSARISTARVRRVRVRRFIYQEFSR